MIIFFSEGRLGNQLYQHALLQKLSKGKERVLCFHMNEFLRSFQTRSKNFRYYSMSPFFYGIYKRVIKPYGVNLLIKLKIIGYISQKREEGIAYPELQEQKGLLPIKYVETHFYQSDQFFDADKVDFQLKSNFINDAKSIWNSLPKNKTYICVHIRRGDYLTELFLKKHPILLPDGYYRKGIDLIVNKVKDPFFIFLSDDPNYVQEAYKDIEEKYISRNSMEVDLALMSYCSYGIMSNSSFSLWGAYLMQKRETVIVPKYWFGWKIKKESHLGIQPHFCTAIEVE